MGRRKIEIKAIKDDRNRSVTFLKRKGGLFKKAHELAVLCSVDVTVIIFGHNKKLYEFSSGDIRETLGRYQYYGQPHEHKGPQDFMDKREADDDDDDDTPTPPEDQAQQVQNNPPPQATHHQQQQQQQQHQQQPQLQPQPFQHLNHAPSASPPIPNGAQYHPRHGTPQPTAISRPASRNNVQHMHPAVIPQQQPHHHSTPPPPPPVQNGYAYMQNANMYNPQLTSNLSQQHMRQAPYQYTRPPTTQPPVSQPPLPQHHPHHAIPLHHQQPYHAQPQPQPHPPHHIPHQQPPQHQAFLHPQQHINGQDHPRRQSMPLAFPQQERQMPQPEPPMQPEQHQIKPEQSQSSTPPKPLATKSRSIFTPIDDHRSVLAQHLALGPPAESPKSELPAPAPPPPPKKEEASNNEPKKASPPGQTPPPPTNPARQVPEPQRTQSLSSIHDIPGISRANSLPSGVKRGPRLTVQIPSENSDAGSGTAGSSPRDGKNAGLTPAKGGSEGGHSAVVLPPPSPSASALLSAGASGPPNPFARPPPPGTTAPGTVETPMSALPSRFVSDALLPSPSLFYPDWNFGRSGPDSNMLPSPLTFPTPVVPTGPGFSRDSDETDKKRKSPDSGPNATVGTITAKRVKVE
ncbi:hypothetical protein VTO42DRAFT_3457 [Malbranchea cinnamomea]